MFLFNLYSLTLDRDSIKEKPKLQKMSTSFYNFDYYLEANEKRDAVIRAEYDKVIGRVSHILIIYSGVSVSLVSICKDLFTFPFNFWYFMAIVLFGIPFMISFVYAVRFLFPVLIPFLVDPQRYYADLRSELENALSNGSALTDEIKEEIDRQIKNTYLKELEAAIEFNKTVIRSKQDNYQKALRYAIFCIFPFITCMIFHLIHQ